MRPRPLELVRPGLLSGAVSLLLAGGVAGWTLRRQGGTTRLPDRPHRPAAVERALTAWAEGDDAALEVRMEAVRALEAIDAPGARAEVRFLEAALAQKIEGGAGSATREAGDG